MAVLLNWSSAVTVLENADPAVAEAGAATAKCVANAGVTVVDALPMIDEVAVSVAVRLCEPAVTNVTPFGNVCAPASAAVKV